MRTLIWIASLAITFTLVGCGKEQPAPPNPPKEAAPVPTQPAPQPAATQAPVEDTVAKNGLARDVVCGDAVDPKKSSEYVYRNTKYYFCSKECLEKFKASPTKFDTGLPGESCVCTSGGMHNCKCGHCKGKAERCPCNDPEDKDKPSDMHDHDH